MKTSTLALVALASFVSPLWAGTEPPAISPAPPVESSPMWAWFVGGTAGYLHQFEEPLYTAHIGVDTPYRIGSWSTSLYVEVGYTENDGSLVVFDPDLEEDVGYDTEVRIIPLTLNLKFERELTHRLNFYTGLGAGVSFVKMDADSDEAGESLSEKDEGFTAQIFAGLIYNLTPHFEVFGGARWMYIDTGHFPIEGRSVLKFHHDYAAELGLRYTF